MRPQEAPRFPDETFYFAPSGSFPELVVDQAVLGKGPQPSVEVYNDRSVIGTTESADGQVNSVDITESSRRLLRGGQRLVRIETGDDRSIWREDDQGKPVWLPGGEVTASYTVQATDKLLVQQTQPVSGATNTIIVPAGDFLPRADFTTYEPLGIITEAGVLVRWGRAAAHDKWLTDLAIASDKVRTPTDLYVLERQVRSAHLLGLIGCSDAVPGYLAHFATQFGVDFMPAKDTRERWAEFPGRLSREQTARYWND